MLPVLSKCGKQCQLASKKNKAKHIAVSGGTNAHLCKKPKKRKSNTSQQNFDNSTVVNQFNSIWHISLVSNVTNVKLNHQLGIQISCS